MNQTTDSKKYYPTALALYITYFVLGIAATIVGQYKLNFAAQWGAKVLENGSYDVSGVVAVIAAIGLGRLIAFPVSGPLSDRYGCRLSGVSGCILYAVFFLGIAFSPNLYVGYVMAVISGMANSFLDTSTTPSCMEIFKEKGNIANVFTKLSVSIGQFVLPFAIRFVAAEDMPFHTIFIVTAVIIIVDGIFLLILPFPPFEKVKKGQGKEKEKMKFTPAARLIGACNTVTVDEEGRLTGHNTDGVGFVRNLQEHGVEVNGKKMVLLGAGGVATAICVQAALDGVSEICIFNRKDEFYANGELTVKKITEAVPGCKISILPLEEEAALKAAIEECDVLVNATKVGMKPLDEQTLVDPSWFRKDLIVADTVYNPRETRMIKEAKEAGCTAVGGIGMLLWQGVAAFKMFTGKDMPAQEVLEKFFS